MVVLQSCEGGRGLILVKDCVLSECNKMWGYLENLEEPMLKEAVKEDFTVEKEGKKKYDRRAKERNETNWKEKSLHGNFSKSIANFVVTVSWQ